MTNVITVTILDVCLGAMSVLINHQVFGALLAVLRLDGVAWEKCPTMGRPYPPIGSTDFGSKWAVSHLRPTRWPIGLAIGGSG